MSRTVNDANFNYYSYMRDKAFRLSFGIDALIGTTMTVEEAIDEGEDRFITGIRVLNDIGNELIVLHDMGMALGSSLTIDNIVWNDAPNGRFKIKSLEQGDWIYRDGLSSYDPDNDVKNLLILVLVDILQVMDSDEVVDKILSNDHMSFIDDIWDNETLFKILQTRLSDRTDDNDVMRAHYKISNLAATVYDRWQDLEYPDLNEFMFIFEGSLNADENSNLTMREILSSPLMQSQGIYPPSSVEMLHLFKGVDREDLNQVTIPRIDRLSVKFLTPDVNARETIVNKRVAYVADAIATKYSEIHGNLTEEEYRGCTVLSIILNIFSIPTINTNEISKRDYQVAKDIFDYFNGDILLPNYYPYIIDRDE